MVNAPSRPSRRLFITDASGAPFTGKKNIQVALWTAETGGTIKCLLQSTATDVANGHFRVALEADCVTAARESGDLWLELQVDGATLPRSRVGAVPYALTADSALPAPGALTSPEQTSPVLVSAQMGIDGAIGTDNSNFLESCAHNGNGNYNCTYTASFFSSAPHCWVQIKSGYAVMSGLAPTTTSVGIQFYAAGGSTDLDAPFYLFCTGQTL